VKRRDVQRIEDELLVLDAQAGDARAQRLLFERWNPRLFRHARRLLGEAEAAREVAQEAWLAIVRGLVRLEDPARFPAWAYRIVTHKAADLIRQRRRRPAGMADAGAVPAPEVEPGAGHDELAQLRRALRRLSPDHRAVVSLFYLEQLSIHEIAHALAIPAGTVKSRLFHARKQLQAELERTTS
jgi:RNA polymerase sigma-70 factor (ECF subfamily)